MMTSWWVAQFVSLVWKATVLLGLFWLGHALLRGRHPGVRRTLWRVAALALVILPLAQFAPPKVQAPNWAPSVSPVLHLGTMVLLAPSPAPVVELGANSAAYAPRSLPWGTVILGLWAVGLGVMAARTMLSHWRLRQLLRNSSPVEREVVMRADTIARDLGKPLDFELRWVADDRSPFLTGWWRPVVGIPRHLAESPRDLDAVLAHELTHRAGGDHRWASFLQWVRILWWPHPLVWGIGAAHRSACEENSDAVAAGFVGDRTWYSALLARMALRTAAHSPTPAISMLNGSEIMVRLRRLAGMDQCQPVSTGLQATLAGLCLVLVLGWGFIALAPRSVSAAREDRTWPAAPEALVKQLRSRVSEADRKAGLEEVQRLFRSDEEGAKEKALAALLATSDIKLDRSAFLEPVRTCLADPSPRVRRMAVTLLSLVGGGPEDLPRLAVLASDPDLSVLEELGTALFWIRPKQVWPERDQLALQLLSHPNPRVRKELMRGSWGHPVGPDVERRMIELSRDPTMTYDAVYYALSTRPVKSLPVAERLIEVMEESGPGEPGSRAQWGLTHYVSEPAAQQRIHEALVKQYDLMQSVQTRMDILFYFGRNGCALSKGKLEAIAADEKEESVLREEAEKLLLRGCPEPQPAK
jgi:beta-lactamase regulating signal transducer with metallopeptidase domain